MKHKDEHFESSSWRFTILLFSKVDEDTQEFIAESWIDTTEIEEAKLSWIVQFSKLNDPSWVAKTTPPSTA